MLHRPEATGPGLLDVLIGEVAHLSELADIPLPEQGEPGAGDRHHALVVVPYRQVRERGFACADDGAPLIAMTVTRQATLPVGAALDRIPDLPFAVSGGHFDVDDDDYAELVRRVVKEAIGEGEGANFVIKRSFVADIGNYTPASALSFFRRLLEVESGAYWTFVVHTGERTFVGATPERHVTLRDGVATMNPISGTYRYPESGPSLHGVMDFLADRKESDELYMVLDEELKMMTRICEPGVRVTGPRLKEMARLAHTEYFIEGDTAWDVRDILRETMFAPTVTGSPVENACRVIDRHEPHGRGYYSGVVALIGHDEAGRQTLDSSILIRTADIDDTGRARIGVGATLVRHSDPMSEVAETRAKTAGLLAALDTGDSGRLRTRPEVREALERRNENIAGFWLGRRGCGTAALPRLAGVRALVVDAEDTFTSMLDHQMRSLGMAVTVRRHDERPSLDGYDLVVLGPGPGDPRDDAHPKIAYLRAAADALLAGRRPFLAVCLSHQVLSTRLGFPLQRRDVPNQGLQKEISLFGARERVGFYNTFAARAEADRAEIDGLGTVEICRDPATGEVHALRGPRFASIQFHAESVLTENGPRILGSLMEGLLP
ncbi:phenazine-specific anthranilate synthase component I [Microbispora triticiradicis]|uniref:anthranilate synthase n=3 Tax=Microbispora TaxID=2005 RepID=A0ABY3LZZ3_9ACTN|nr:phenazine-specific anthranilate synthase component I [Microbispora triticiradicis]TLP58945.1 phenazine-specific anthranilate synthase component I [Microbispora fusca]TYB61658.1 phenazine-specific anthranilate synthase component I [Microbispora tritici]